MFFPPPPLASPAGLSCLALRTHAAPKRALTRQTCPLPRTRRARASRTRGGRSGRRRLHHRVGNRRRPARRPSAGRRGAGARLRRSGRGGRAGRRGAMSGDRRTTLVASATCGALARRTPPSRRRAAGALPARRRVRPRGLRRGRQGRHRRCSCRRSSGGRATMPPPRGRRTVAIAPP